MKKMEKTLIVPKIGSKILVNLDGQVLVGTVLGQYAHLKNHVDVRVGAATRFYIPIRKIVPWVGV